ncbi:MAG: peptidoglycan DD-metalloendopeptidase family protein [Geminicoccaceae bacterium]|nr:peptidoglycan DD-metalloendopeptidase family protein [Geminicoccaceae bacterium]
MVRDPDRRGLLRWRAPAALAAVLLLVAGCAADPPPFPARLAALPQARPEPLPPGGRHLVMPGETVSALSRRYALPPDGIIRMNALEEPYFLYVGQVLQLQDTPPPAPRPAPRLHEVRPGESMMRIARLYGLGLGDLIALNKGSDPNDIRPGQVLRLPAAIGGPAPPAVAARPSPPLEIRVVEAPTPAERRQQLADARSAATRPPPARSGEGFLWPVKGRILSAFGPRPDGRRNDGVNIEAVRGAVVRAAENGIVVYAGEAVPAFGRMLLIRHADGYLTAYAHNDALLVVQGDAVARGQPVARAGTSGRVNRPQLHFELRKGGAVLDPKRLMPPLATQLASGAG